MTFDIFLVGLFGSLIGLTGFFGIAYAVVKVKDWHELRKERRRKHGAH